MSEELANEKLRAEIAKLKVETQNLQKSRFSVFADWTKVIGGVILGSVGTWTFFVQWQIAEAKQKSAETATSLAKLEQAQIKTATESLKEENIRVGAETERLRQDREELFAQGNEIKEANVALQRQIEENKKLATSDAAQLKEIAQATTARTASLDATLKEIKRPTVFVYYANSNQSERYKADFVRTLKNNGFAVGSEQIAGKGSRAEETSYVLYFHTADAAAARSLASSLKTQLDVRDCEVRAVPEPAKAPVPTGGRKAGEIEVWLDKSERSPVAGLIRLTR
jgi:hypothetical protein